jgi:voltage-gated potassium channel
MHDAPPVAPPVAPRLSRERLRRILDGEDERLGRPVGLVIQALIISSVLTISLETLPNMPDWALRAFRIEEMIVVTIFLAEYLARIYAAENRLRYIFSFWGIIDFVAIAPSLLATGLDARHARALRLIKLVRLLKLARYGGAMDRLDAAFRMIRPELGVFLVIASIVLYLCAAGIYLFEHEAQPEKFESIPHSLWWAVATLTTVGYGDVYPITAGGRIFTGLVLIVGLGVIAVPVGLISAALSTGRKEAHGSSEHGAPPEPLAREQLPRQELREASLSGRPAGTVGGSADAPGTSSRTAGPSGEQA